MQGKIIKGIGGFYYVHDGIGKVYECRAKGIFRNRGIKPLVGDDVEISVLDEEKATGNLDEILPKLKEYTTGNVVDKVTCSEKKVLRGTGKKVALLDLGAKNNIAKSLNARGCEVTINNVNVPSTEMTSILVTKGQGCVYFFSMATSFTKAALGAEGVGKDINLIVGNGYAKGHAELTLNIIRESEEIRELFNRLYVK